MKFDVISFGSAVVDTFITTSISEKDNFITYKVGDKILIDDLKFDIGGGATNTAVAFSRLGLKTGCICKIGEDENGERVLRLLKKEKVKFLGKIDLKKITGYSVILNSKEKNRTVLTYKGANNELDLNELNLRKIKTKWIYCSSLLGKSLQTQKKLIKVLTKNGVKFAFNPSSYLIKKENLSSLLELCEILILNKQEAMMLLDENRVRGKDLLIGLSNLGPKKVVITDKNKLISCYDSKTGKKYFLKPHRMNVVERTGAGDAFASGFVAGQIAGKLIIESLKLGLMESESVIKHFGAKNNLIKRKLK